jgi:hypothetical protein
MNARRTAGRVLGGLTISLALLAVPVGGAFGGDTLGASPTPAPTPSIIVTRNVFYEPVDPSDPARIPGILDVYAPAKAGSWPVVVMFHGFQGSKSDLAEHARKVADLGFVVFSATWDSNLPTIGGDSQAYQSQGACAVAFARAHAGEYGGDPAPMIVFGHSAGAHIASMVAFARPEPSPGCLGGTSLGPIDALVTWEGNWVLSATEPTIMDWDGLLAADPTIMESATPWAYLAEHEDLRVAMLVSDQPGDFFKREVGDPWAADSWLAVRDPSGDLRRQLEANGAFADGVLDFVEVQQLLFSVLQAQGNPVTLDVMPGSRHDYLGPDGWPVFLAAFPKAAAQG